MRVLVTGSSGQIGTNRALRLLADGRTHRLLRDEASTVDGGEGKTLGVTYVDDRVDGIVRGGEALAAGRLANETINLAYGRGNTLVRCAELIASAVGAEPRIRLAPTPVGEVTRYVADVPFDWVEAEAEEAALVKPAP